MAPGDPEVESLLGQLQCLAGHTFTVEDLPGGLTNRNFKVTTTAARYVVRIASSSAGLLAIDRDSEYRNSAGAAQAGVGAPVVEYRPDLGVLVVGFLDARTCTAEDLCDLERLRRVARACQRLHRGPRFRHSFNMFAIQQHYLSVVGHHGFRLPPRYMDFVPHVEQIKTALAASDEGTVPCHNDLLAGNCLDDGKRIWLIDYEYSGNNDPCFELGNLWSESALPVDHLLELVAAYYGAFSAQKVARSRLQGIMSKYGWTLWASIQAGTATLDFDFWSWGMEKYDRVLSEFTHVDFTAWLRAAAQPERRALA